MTRTLWFLIETIGSLLVCACVLRAVAARVRLSPHNPIVQFLVAVTEWLVAPLRRLIPASRTVEWPSVAAAVVVAIALALLWSLVFAAGRVPAVGAVLLLAAFWLLKWSLYLLTAMVVLHAILSWVNPHAPIAPALEQLTRPLLAPFRRVIPPVGGVDLSPLVLIVLAQLLIGVLESAFVSLATR